MGYVGRHLLPGEKVLLEVKVHPALWLLPVAQIALMAVVLAACFFGMLWIGSTAYAAWGVGLIAIGIVAAGNALIWLLLIPNHLGAYLSWELVVTNRRIVRKGGLLRTEVKELPLDKVETLSASQAGIWGRMFGYGEIEIVGLGGTRLTIDHAVDPVGFRVSAQAILDDASGGDTAR